jgi:hypothetical protein
MPISVKRTETVEKDGQQVEQEACATWFVYKNHWFVLSQTDGRAYEPEPIPVGMRRRPCTHWKLERHPLQCSMATFRGTPKIVTLFHELAHVVLGHTTEGSLNSDSKDRTPRDIRELEAECVALLCCESLGLPGASESRGNIQSWFKGNEVPERSAQRIFHAADEILKAGRTA